MKSILTALLLSALATARKTYLMKTETNIRVMPRVEAIAYDWHYFMY